VRELAIAKLRWSSPATSEANQEEPDEGPDENPHAHLGNASAFFAAEMIREISGYKKSDLKLTIKVRHNLLKLV
jgi:hypothetical protein